MGRTFRDLEVKIHLTAFTRHFWKVVKSSIALQQTMVRQLLPLGLELHLDPDHASKFAHNALPIPRIFCLCAAAVSARSWSGLHIKECECTAQMTTSQ